MRARKQPGPDDEFRGDGLVDSAINSDRSAVRFPARGAASTLARRRLKPLLDRSSVNPDAIRLKRVLREFFRADGGLFQHHFDAKTLQRVFELRDRLLHRCLGRAAPIASPALFIYKTLPANLKCLHLVSSDRFLRGRRAPGQQRCRDQ